MIKFLLHLLFLSLLCVGLSTCKHEPPKDICEYDASLEEMKKWYFFKTGSYWIYEEVNSGARDTVTVYFDEEGISPGGFDYWTMNTYSSYYDYDFNYRFNDSYTVNCLSSRNCQCKKVNRSKVRPGDFVGDENLFLYPIILGNYNYLGTGGSSTVIEVFDTISIGEMEFQNVNCWFADNCLTENINPINWDDGVPAKFYFAQEVGIVRKEVLEYIQDWQLVEFQTYK
jgi:hypothetical protein